MLFPKTDKLKWFSLEFVSLQIIIVWFLGIGKMWSKLSPSILLETGLLGKKSKYSKGSKYKSGFYHWKIIMWYFFPLRINLEKIWHFFHLSMKPEDRWKYNSRFEYSSKHLYNNYCNFLLHPFSVSLYFPNTKNILISKILVPLSY